MLTHKECNPGRLEKNQQQEGLLLHEWKVQMGLSQGDLLALQESFQATESTNSRRDWGQANLFFVVCKLRLRPYAQKRLGGHV